MAETFMELKGLKEITDRLKSIPADLEKNALDAATRNVAREAVNDIKAKTPQKTGKLRDSFKASMRKSSAKLQRVAYITGRWYGRLIERGFFHVRGKKHIAPRPFMRPVFDKLSVEYPQKIADAVAKRLKYYERKAAKRAPK